MKIWKKWGTNLLTATMILGLPAMAAAEQREYSTVGEYVMTDYESMEAAETRAFDIAKQSAIEQAGVLVENYTRTENMMVVEDGLHFTTNKAMKVINKKTEVNQLPSGEMKVVVRLLAKVDTADVDRILYQKQEELEKLIKSYNEVRKNMQELQEETNKIKARLQTVSDQESINKNAEELKINELQILANQEREKALEIYDLGYEDDIDKEMYKKMEMLCKSAVNIDAKNYENHLIHGVAVEKLNQINEVIKNYNIVIELNKNNETAYNNRGVAYEQKGDYDKALKDYNKAIEIAPTKAEAPYHNRARVQIMKSSDYNSAIQDLKKSLEINPYILDNCNFLAKIYVKLGEKGKAKECFENALKIAKNNNKWRVYNNRGCFFDRIKEYDKAINDFNTAMNLLPENTTKKLRGIIYANRGKTYSRKKEYDNAITDLEMAVRINPRDYDAWYNLELVYKNKGRYYEAIKIVDDILGKVDDNEWKSKLLMSRGDAYDRLKQYTTAISDYNMAIKFDDSNDMAYEKLGTLYNEHIRDYNKAILNLSKAVELDGKNWIAEYNLALTYLNKKDADKCIEVAKNYIRKYPKDAKGYDVCGAGYELKGMYGMAIQFFEKAVQLDPRNTVYREILEQAKRKNR